MADGRQRDLRRKHFLKKREVDRESCGVARPRPNREIGKEEFKDRKIEDRKIVLKGEEVKREWYTMHDALTAWDSKRGSGRGRPESSNQIRPPNVLLIDR